MGKNGVALVVLLLAGCGGTSGTSSTDAADDNAKAKAEFWQAFNGGDVAGVTSARDHMKAAFDSHPDDDETARLIGMAYAFTNGQALVGGGPPPPSFFTDVDTMLSYLDKAIAIATDPKQKAFDNGEYGAALWSVSAAKGDTASEQRAKDLMDQKAAAYPVAGQFAIATILYSAPAGSDALKKALDAQFNGMDLCASTHFDRAHPDVSVYLHARFTDPACGNDPKFPHHMQGGLFKLADMLAKNGQADAARPVYEAIKNSDGYETWQFKNLVQDRMNSDLTLPLKGGLPCLACHQN